MSAVFYFKGQQKRNLRPETPTMTAITANRPLGYFAALLFLADMWSGNAHAHNPPNPLSIEIYAGSSERDFYGQQAAKIVREEESVRMLWDEFISESDMLEQSTHFAADN